MDVKVAMATFIMEVVQVGVQLVQGYRKGSREVAGFKKEVENLRAMEKFHRDLVNIGGTNTVEFIQPRLEDAKVALEALSAKAERLEQSSVLRNQMKLFPGELTADIDLCRQKIQRVFKDLKEAEKHSIRVKALTFNDPDKKFVYCRQTGDAVRQALNLKDNNVVIIYGESGSGKTCLARYLALLYSGLLGAESPTKDSGEFWPDDGVVFLKCGKKARVQNLSSQLCDDLGHSKLVASTSSSSTDPFEILAVLTRHVRDKSILIVLDDVWESKVMQGLFIQAKGVKYLLTTPRKSVWRTRNCQKVPISRPSMEECLRIFENHSAGPGAIPENFKFMVEDIIGTCGGNPSKIANVAHKFGQEDVDYANLFLAKLNAGTMMEGVSNKSGLGGPTLFRRTYSKGSRSEAIMNTVEYLDEETKKLLHIGALWRRDRPIPEIFFKLFFEFLQSDIMTFSGCLDTLAEFDFIRKVDPTNWIINFSQDRWKVDKERSDFIRHVYGEDVLTIVNQIFSKGTSNICVDKRSHKTFSEDEVELLLVFFSVFGEIEWFQDAVQKMGNVVTYSKYYCIEPLIILLREDFYHLHQESSSVKKKECLSFARKVIVKYLQHSTLHKEGVEGLLKMDEISPMVCMALFRMDVSIFTQEHEHIFVSVKKIQNTWNQSKRGIECLDSRGYYDLDFKTKSLKCNTPTCMQNLPREVLTLLSNYVTPDSTSSPPDLECQKCFHAISSTNSSIPDGPDIMDTTQILHVHDTINTSRTLDGESFYKEFSRILETLVRNLSSKVLETGVIRASNESDKSPEQRTSSVRSSNHKGKDVIYTDVPSCSAKCTLENTVSICVPFPPCMETNTSNTGSNGFTSENFRRPTTVLDNRFKYGPP